MGFTELWSVASCLFYSTSTSFLRDVPTTLSKIAFVKLQVLWIGALLGKCVGIVVLARSGGCSLHKVDLHKLDIFPLTKRACQRLAVGR